MRWQRWIGAFAGRAPQLALLVGLSRALVSENVPRGNPECWTSGFTWEQCCNVLYGAQGNPICWDADRYNFQHCCRGEVFEAHGCGEFVAHFDFSVTRLLPEAWEKCASAMEQQPELCNSARTTRELCPACTDLSALAVRYIGCVREEQARATPANGADPRDGPRPAVGGVHYPTVFVPRMEGRDFSVVAPAFDAYVGNRLVIDGRWMDREVRLLTGLTSPGEVFVDAGANIGGFVLPLAKHLGEEGKVHAFEPFRLLFQCLNANVMINGLSNVHTYQVGLGNATESVQRRQPNLNAISNPSKMHVVEEVASELLVRTDPRPTAQEAVQVIRLDDVDFAGRGPAVIKVDVESMELPMLQGASRTLQDYRPVLYVEDSEVPDDSDGRHRPTRVMQFLYARDYYLIDLIRSGLADMTSSLFVPLELQQEITDRIRRIDWNA